MSSTTNGLLSSDVTRTGSREAILCTLPLNDEYMRKEASAKVGESDRDTLPGSRRRRPGWPALPRRFRRWWRSWRGLRRRDALRDRVAGLAEHEPALRAHARSVEAAFVAVGAALHEQIGLSAQLVDAGRRFQSFTAEDAATNPVREAIGLVERTLKSLDGFQRASAKLVENLQAAHEQIAQLRLGGARFQRAVAPLRIIDTLFRIEAARQPAEMQVAFAALTDEIGRLDEGVRETFTRHFDALRATGDAIATVAGQLAGQRAAHQGVAATQRAAMRDSLRALDADIAGVRERDERTAAFLGAIDRDANSIVVGLQYQDITRQKLEHVIGAVGGLIREADGATPGGMEQTARLEAHQLAAIDDDLREAMGTIDHGLRTIVGRLRQLESECLPASECNRAAATVGTTVDTLVGILADVRGEMDQAVAGATHASQAVRAFGGLTADLTDTIRDLTWGIRLIALNAQVKAAQVARCDGLEVLARQTYLVSDETSQFAAHIGGELGQLADRLRNLIASVEQLGRMVDEARRSFDSTTIEMVRRLREQRESVVDAFQRFSPLVGQTREHAARLLATAALAGIDRQPLAAAQRKLEGFTEWCAENLVAENDPAARARLAAIRRDYTMAAERHLHDAIVKQAADDAAVAGPRERLAPPVVGRGADHADANVELF